MEDRQMTNYSVSEIAKLTGISVRTLHYYDEIGLLSPSTVLETGYRYYDQSALERLQQILFYKELDFPLKQITQILMAPDYQKEDVFKKQREMLLLKRKRLNKLIRLLEANLKGEKSMSFEAFDTSAIAQAKEKYAKEVKACWGDTQAYQESIGRTETYSKEDWNKAMARSDEIMKGFSSFVKESPASPSVQKLVEEWRTFISETYYNCTKEILAGLGEMYVCDQRFGTNIDKFGEGTAKLMSEAIKIYVNGEKS